MDYKYIEQLLDRYWECHTTVEEEQILRTFFSQKGVPAHLARFAPLFALQVEAGKDVLPEDFDRRVEALVEAREGRPAGRVRVEARAITFGSRLMPLFKAAAVIALFLAVGGAMERSMMHNSDVPHATQPAAAGTYVRSGQVAAIVGSATQRSEAAITAQADSLHAPRLTPEQATATE